ncbi:30S ribosomal protein S4 [Candidatus Thorarchaeota archaeon]|nr:MAG: 30S ribosomal protein S4 [Candidatus Thorarchaeota archaeon]
MGDPRRQKKKYVSPKAPFDSDRFEQELQLVGLYGLRNKKELWKHRTELSNYRRQARHLLALPPSERAQVEKELVTKLTRIGILTTEPTLDSVLDLTLENLLERRLQTLVFRKGFAASMHHARQLVTHGHIALDQGRVTTPARLITIDESNRIAYTTKSALNDQSHPARIAASDAATRVTAQPDNFDEEPRKHGPRGRRDSTDGSNNEEPVTDDEIGPIGGDDLE